MHTLLLLKHAKADSLISLADYERPLSDKGKRDTPLMAKRLLAYAYKPDMIISSSALRAKMTAEIFSKTLEAELFLNDKLYNADEITVLKLIKNMDEDITNLMLVGHNPTWENLVEYFTGERMQMHPCSMVQISFDSKWEEIEEGCAKIIYFDSV